MERITVKGARQNNLKNIDLSLPRKALVVVSGLSGSGKSSLVFDTLYQESRRRFFETLPTYVLQFMERVPRPDFDSIEGLSPAVAVEQRNPVRSSRSTVGTLTEIYDYLRVIYARAGVTLCPGCSRPVVPDTPQSVSAVLLEKFPGSLANITFPVRMRSGVVCAGTACESLLALGFLRVVCPPARGDSLCILRLDEPGSIERLSGLRQIHVVADRLRLEPANTGRLAESLREAFNHGEQVARVYIETGGVIEPLDFSSRFHCASCDITLAEPTPNLFSFNSPYGACPECRGFGCLLDYDEARIVPDTSLSIEQGALDPWTKPRYERRRTLLKEFCRGQKIDIRTPWADLEDRERRLLLEGAVGFTGVLPFLRALERKRYKQYIRFYLRRYQSERTCGHCSGNRLRAEARSVLVGGRKICELTSMSLGELSCWIEALPERLGSRQIETTREPLSEIRARLEYLESVGLGYLSLERMTKTLSGGEYQRIMLTRLLGSRLTETLFVLDEPTIGLHQRDTQRLIRVIRKLVDTGNSLVVVEHDREVIDSADHVLELGPGAGEEGGQVVASAGAKEFSTLDTPTARWLAEPASRQLRTHRRQKKKKTASGLLRIRGATFRNLKNIDVEIPLRQLTCVSGVSGSGKSSLVTGVIYPGLESKLAGRVTTPERCQRIEGYNTLGSVVLIDQSPIGRTPRSNPVTYIKAFDEIRHLFAATAQARRSGFAAGYFSFNTPGGRCERCKGAGHERIEMLFMADIFVPCEACQAKRYKTPVLKVLYRGRSIGQVLEMTVNQAIEFFAEHPKIGKPLWLLQSVGLGYLRLGQSALTLSGGESQRLKIARGLSEGTRGRGRLYIMDEPTTGLHALEVRRLLRVIQRLIEAGNTVLVVEHHPEVIACADWIVDLGPEGGGAGGRVLVQGPPETVAACPESHTGKMLRG
ncbi:MAG: excinuclease ABC subunit UvrA [Gemmatimonadota bacterium]|nr:excinuclease ABC subunit UvrA [Gemmatimonadota bacterium]